MVGQLIRVTLPGPVACLSDSVKTALDASILFFFFPSPIFPPSDNSIVKHHGRPSRQADLARALWFLLSPDGLIILTVETRRTRIYTTQSKNIPLMIGDRKFEQDKKKC